MAEAEDFACRSAVDNMYDIFSEMPNSQWIGEWRICFYKKDGVEWGRAACFSNPKGNSRISIH